MAGYGKAGIIFLSNEGKGVSRKSYDAMYEILSALMLC